MHLTLIPSTHIDRAWRDGAHLLSEACEQSGGEITGDQLKLMLSRGERMLFAGVKDERPVGWCAGGIEQLPNVRVFHIYSVWARGNLHMEFVNELAAFAKTNGCSELRCAAKPAQARLYRMKYAFEPVYEVLRKEIE